MKILLLNGSPRREGTVARLLAAIAAEAEGRAEVETIHVADLAVAPCRGCMACRSRLRCVLPEDGAQRVLESIRSCDALVVGAPCYWGNVPGQLKVLFDRIVYGLMGESPRGIPVPLHRGKRAAVVTACTTPWPFNRLFKQSSGTAGALREILKWSGFRTVACIEKGGTRLHPDITPRELRKCQSAARRLMGRRRATH